jgi:hypothetical protein
MPHQSVALINLYVYHIYNISYVYVDFLRHLKNILGEENDYF